jgi:hypothetical protein
MIASMPPSARVSGSHVRAGSYVERLLRAVGADPQIVEDVLGDLTEEYASRIERDGAGMARTWYVREIVRSAPHLVAHTLRRAAHRHPARLVACLVTAVALPIAVVLTYQTRSVVRLAAGSESGYVVNSVRPVPLPVRVFDARGRLRKSTDVRFRWLSGTSVAITPSGVATCAESGDATVRASLGTLSADLPVHCRPVREVFGPPMLDLVVGDSAREVPFDAVGPDGRPVTLLAGQFAVGDSSVATLDGPRIRARKAGSTWVRARFGESASFTSVHVYERTSSLGGIRPGQHVAVPVRLEFGDMRQWQLAAGDYFLKMLPDSAAQERPHLAVTGANCKSVLSHVMCSVTRVATVWVFSPRDAAPASALRGTLAVWREEDP